MPTIPLDAIRYSYTGAKTPYAGGAPRTVPAPCFSLVYVLTFYRSLQVFFILCTFLFAALLD
jgi:hypothetical protein